MAQSTVVSNTIILKYVSGVQPDGKDIIKTTKVGNVRTNISDSDMLIVGQAIMNIIGKNVVGIGKSLEYELTE